MEIFADDTLTQNEPFRCTKSLALNKDTNDERSQIVDPTEDARSDISDQDGSATTDNDGVPKVPAAIDRGHAVCQADTDGCNEIPVAADAPLLVAASAPIPPGPPGTNDGSSRKGKAKAESEKEKKPETKEED